MFPETMYSLVVYGKHDCRRCPPSPLGLALSILIQSGRWNPGPEWHGRGLAGLLSHRGYGSRRSSCPFSRDIKVRARARAWYGGGGRDGRAVKKSLSMAAATKIMRVTPAIVSANAPIKIANHSFGALSRGGIAGLIRHFFGCIRRLIIFFIFKKLKLFYSHLLKNL